MFTVTTVSDIFFSFPKYGLSLICAQCFLFTLTMFLRAIAYSSVSTLALGFETCLHGHWIPLSNDCLSISFFWLRDVLPPHPHPLFLFSKKIGFHYFIHVSLKFLGPSNPLLQLPSSLDDIQIYTIFSAYLETEFSQGHLLLSSPEPLRVFLCMHQRHL